MSEETHDIEIATDFLGGRYEASCKCGWMSGAKANRHLAAFVATIHTDNTEMAAIERKRRVYSEPVAGDGA